MNRLPVSYQRMTIYLVIISTILRICFASLVELENDEVYYWTYARHLQWNYFDHPPMVAFCIRLFTANLHFNQELFIRFASMLSSALSTYLIFSIGRKLHNDYAGWIAALVFTASFYASVLPAY